MADNELDLEVGAVYLYALPNFPPELLLCTTNIAGDEKLLTGWYSEWGFNTDKDGSFNAKYLRKLAPSVQALVEQVVPFGF